VIDLILAILAPIVTSGVILAAAISWSHGQLTAFEALTVSVGFVYLAVKAMKGFTK
jgi:hypothetical protein